MTRVVRVNNKYRFPGLIIEIGPVNGYYLFRGVYPGPGRKGYLAIPPPFLGDI